MGEGVGVDVGIRADLGMGAKRRLDHLGVVEVRRRPRRGRERGRELAEGQVLTPPVDQPEGGHVPEQGSATVAQGDLVAVGQGEQLTQAGPYPADHRADRRGPVAGAQVGPGVGGQGVHGALGDLRRPAAEAAVAGQQVGGQTDIGGERGHDVCNYRAHGPSLGAYCVNRRIRNTRRRRQGEGAEGGGRARHRFRGG